MRRSIQIDRSVIFVAESNEALEEQDIEYWNNASVKEKLQTITYLIECFYGTKATTGRLQRFHKVLKLKGEQDTADAAKLEKHKKKKNNR